MKVTHVIKLSVHFEGGLIMAILDTNPQYEAAKTYWAKAQKEKIKRFNAVTGRVELIEAGKAGNSYIALREKIKMMIEAGVEYIELPKAI